MLSLAERQADRAKRKALNAKESPYNGITGGYQNPDGSFAESQEGFVEGEDGFSRAGIGVVNPMVATTLDASKVKDVKGVTDPVTGKPADAANAAADEHLKQAQTEHEDASVQAAAGWGTQGAPSLAGGGAGVGQPGSGPVLP